MRSTNKEVISKIHQYILETVYTSEEEQFKTFEDAAKYLLKEFERVSGHQFNLRKFPNNQDRFLDYLQGVPFYFPVYDYQVEEILNSFGINPENKKYPSSKMWQTFAALIFREINKTIKK